MFIVICVASATTNSPTSTVAVGINGIAYPKTPDPLIARNSSPMKRLDLLTLIPVFHRVNFSAISMSPAYADICAVCSDSLSGSHYKT